VKRHFIALISVLPLALPLTSARAVAAKTDGATRCPVTTVYRAAPDRSGEPIGFTDMTDHWGADTPLTGMLAHTAAAADVNHDGWSDVFVGTFADRPEAEYQRRGASGPSPDRLLLGGPQGFRLDESFPETRGRTSGAAFADLDGDGNLDLVIARNVRDAERGSAPTEILRNDGGGRFTRVATFAEPRGARSIGFLDYDADGKTDIFIAEDRWTGGSSVLLHDDGNFKFSDRTGDAGLPRDIVGMGVSTADLNGDGTPDLFVGGSNRIFLNRGGSFSEGRSATFRWRTFGPEDDPAGVAAGDVNRDGRIDLLVGQHYGSTLDGGQRVPIRLYLNDGNDGDGTPRFRDVTEEAGLVPLSTKAPHVEIADFDNDGWPDLLTSADTGSGVPVVFRNLGVSDGQVRFAPTGDATSRHYWPSGVVFDADHDGRLDVVLVDFDAGLPSLFLRNTGRAGDWFGVAADAGWTVEVSRANGSGQAAATLGSVTIAASTGFGAGESPVAWFGLGNARAVDVRLRDATGRQVRVGTHPADRLIAADCKALSQGS
jgi:enediyne biosynthesis protein E4